MDKSKTFKFKYLLQGWWLILIVAMIAYVPSMAYSG